MVKLLCLCCFCSVLLIKPSAYGREYVYGFMRLWPYYYIDKTNGVAKGRIIDVMRQVEASSDYRFHYKEYPAKRFYHEIAGGTVQVSTTVKSRIAKDLMYFGEQLVVNDKIKVYGKNLDNIHTIVDLRQRRVAVVRGLTYAGLNDQINDTKNQLQIIKSNSHNSMFMLLDKGRVEFVIDYHEAAKKALVDKGLGPYQEVLLGSVAAYFVVAKQVPNGKALVADLDRMLVEQRLINRQ